MKYVIIIAIVLFLVYNVAKLIKAIIDKKKSKASKEKGGEEKNLAEEENKNKGDND